MKNITITKNENFHRQLKSEKIQEMTIILLLSFNNKTVYDIVCCNNYKQLEKRIKEVRNNIIGIAYIAVTDSMKFIEYKRLENK